MLSVFDIRSLYFREKMVWSIDYPQAAVLRQLYKWIFFNLLRLGIKSLKRKISVALCQVYKKLNPEMLFPLRKKALMECKQIFPKRFNIYPFLCHTCSLLLSITSLLGTGARRSGKASVHKSLQLWGQKYSPRSPELIISVHHHLP